MNYKWLLYALPIGVAIWVLFAIRITFAIKKRTKRRDEETFEKRNN